MPIIQKTAKTCVRPNTIKKYRDMGINCNVNDIINIPIEKLSKSSHVLLNCKCDKCGKNLKREYRDCLKKKDILCEKCFPSILGKSKKDDSFIGKKFGRLTILERSSKAKHLQKVRCICDCGKEMEGYLSNIKKGTTSSCGCLKKELQTGENNNRWNENLTEKDRKKQRKLRHLSQSLAYECHKKCNFKCYNCKSNRKIIAHHLNSWKLFPEERFDQNNLITLCNKCHKEYHRNVNIKNVTKENFYIFFK